MKQSQLTRIIKRIEDLPTLPKTVLTITELVNNPKSSARDLAKVVSDDQVLTARLLKLVNSSFYGFPQKFFAAPAVGPYSLIIHVDNLSMKVFNDYRVRGFHKYLGHINVPSADFFCAVISRQTLI